jgi:hypothetical protein
VLAVASIFREAPRRRRIRHPDGVTVLDVSQPCVTSGMAWIEPALWSIADA